MHSTIRQETKEDKLASSPRGDRIEPLPTTLQIGVDCIAATDSQRRKLQKN